MKLLDFLRNRMASLTSGTVDDYGAPALSDGLRGDIYLVLVRDRAVRRQVAVSRRADRRRDAGWPFIR